MTQFKEGDPVILTNLKYAGRDSDDIADVVIFPNGSKLTLFEPLFGPSNLVSASALDEIKRLREEMQTIAEEGSGWGQSVALAALKRSVSDGYC